MNKLLLLSITAIFSYCTQAQTSLNAIGDTYSSTNGTVTFSVGITAYTSLVTDSFEVNQGVQHPIEHFSTSVNQLQKGIDDLTVFPNPFSQSFTVNGAFNEINYVVSDIQGRSILKGQLIKGEPIPSEYLPNGFYLLHLTGNSTSNTSTIKLIKN